MSRLSSDILENQFGSTEIEIVSQSDSERVIRTVARDSGKVLELSNVKFRHEGIKEFPQIHKEILGGKSIGKVFRDKHVEFVRKVSRQSRDPASGELIIEVSILVGPNLTPYADILETYSAEVNWNGGGPVVLIDNYDSFTYNLYQQIAMLGYEVQVFKHDQVTLGQIEELAPSHIVISPGPKRPENSGISLDVIGRFYKTVPILGVCLGMQCLGAVFGGKIAAAARIMHGKTDSIYHEEDGLFADVPNPFIAARYHSLVVGDTPKDFLKTAWSEDGSLMAIRHKSLPVYGVQFHPESFMTEHGETIMRNFLNDN